jgi:RNA polymerase sigma-70 factor (ECF subfamily)
MNETQIIEQSKRGDSSAFTTLMNQYKEKIYRLASKFFHNACDREDIVQETFLRVYANLHRVDTSKGFSSWIYRIGTNLCIDTIRRRAHYPITSSIKFQEEDVELQNLFLSNEKTPEECLEDKENSEKLRRLIELLPSKYKPFIYERYILEMSLEEIAVSNSMPINTVKSRLHRARAELQKKWMLDSNKTSDHPNRMKLVGFTAILSEEDVT